MKRATAVASAVGVVAIAGAAVLAVANGRVSFCSHSASSTDPAACDTGMKGAVAQASGKVLGKFDPAMAGCRFACATKEAYDAKSIVTQPGAEDGQLTQCPVSGVVFSVDVTRPHVQIGTDDYVTCCDTCAGKLRKDPRRFLRA